ncbi:MAG TPA: hypothetical protein VFB66_17595 [Tepidisphaeraceae bacterium]|nr:hypothetical protein [Tepidisphaeraceae bacterium]
MVPLLVFVACTAVVMVNRGSGEGSAVSGYVRDSRYVLPLGKGGYHETTPERFEALRRRECNALLGLAGMLASGAAAAYVIRRAGLPVVPGQHSAGRRRFALR